MDTSAIRHQQTSGYLATAPRPAWTKRHDLRWRAQTEQRPNETTGWWEHRGTELIHIMCNCGYSSGWITRDQAPTREQLLADHGPTAPVVTGPA